MESDSPQQEAMNSQTPDSKLPSSLTTVTPFSKYLALILFILLPFAGFYLGVRYQQTQTQIMQPTPDTTNVSGPIPTVVYTVAPTTNDSVSDKKTDQFMPNLKVERKFANQSVEIDPGFILLNSIVSNNQDTIVYSQISNCIEFDNDYEPSTTCNWEYRIKVKDLSDSSTRTIHSDSSSNHTTISLFSFVKPVYAGGCKLIWIPVGWSPNDQKIILEWGNPTDCGMGGAPQYKASTISVDGGEIEYLAKALAQYSSDNSFVIYIDSSDLTPAKCEHMGEKNESKIVSKNVESGETTIILEEPNTLYRLDSIDDQAQTLAYRAHKVEDLDSKMPYPCISLDDAVRSDFPLLTIDISQLYD